MRDDSIDMGADSIDVEEDSLDMGYIVSLFESNRCNQFVPVQVQALNIRRFWVS